MVKVKLSDRTDQRPELRQAYLESIRGRADDGAPNIVLVFVDDMGHGDLSCFGSEAIDTPSLDQLATDGVKLTSFYASSPVCSPSRFGCLTGRYPTRGFIHGVFFPSSTAMGKGINRAFFPRGVNGILPDEITVAEALRAGGYRTGIFGKWHLGDHSPHPPTDHGFDHVFGSYYSNDMEPYAFYRNDQVAIEAPADQTTLTTALTTEIQDFIRADTDRPFFVYYASPFPHDPVHASDEFTGSSKGGTYGDCVQELDWSVGEIRRTLDEQGLTDNTLVIFTSDNGPWHEGSPGLHRGRKGNTFDGGQIVPFIASWPDVIPRGIESEAAAMNIDFFPTFLRLAGLSLPTDRVIDGVDMLDVLTGDAGRSPHDELLMIKGKRVVGLRSRDNFKYLARHRSDNSSYAVMKHGPFLFDLDHDPDESYDVTAHHPETADELRHRLEAAGRDLADNPRGWIGS